MTKPTRMPPGDDPRAGKPIPGLISNHRKKPRHKKSWRQKMFDSSFWSGFFWGLFDD